MRRTAAIRFRRIQAELGVRYPSILSRSALDLPPCAYGGLPWDRFWGQNLTKVVPGHDIKDRFASTANPALPGHSLLVLDLSGAL